MFDVQPSNAGVAYFSTILLAPHNIQMEIASMEREVFLNKGYIYIFIIRIALHKSEGFRYTYVDINSILIPTLIIISLFNVFHWF